MLKHLWYCFEWHFKLLLILVIDKLHTLSEICQHLCRGGGIGRRAGLKHQWEQSHVGSSPTLGTKKGLKKALFFKKTIIIYSSSGGKTSLLRAFSCFLISDKSLLVLRFSESKLSSKPSRSRWTFLILLVKSLSTLFIS